MDRLTPEQRSRNMSHVRGKETKIEQQVRSWLFSHGYRYRKNDNRLPGKPDIVLPKYKAVIFINGCFWHQHPGCKKATIPKSNVAFWSAKLNRNTANDAANAAELQQLGWHVIVIWECELKKVNFESRMLQLDRELHNQQGQHNDPT